jgi:tRNA1(Val) A37 N6-methylase TrmN6
VSVTEGTLLGGRVRYRQFETGHRSGFEPVLLAAAVPAKPGELVLEAGTGAGAGLLCLAARVPGLIGTGLEIDPALVALANENFRINEFDGIVAKTGDAATPPDLLADHVFANPPWHDAAGSRSPDGARALAHHAASGLLTRWIAGLSRAVRPGGSLTLILPAAGLSEAVAGLRLHRYGGTALFPLWPRAGRPAGQFILSARLGAKSADRILPGLTLHDEAGLTAQAEAILRAGAPLR